MNASRPDGSTCEPTPTPKSTIPTDPPGSDRPRRRRRRTRPASDRTRDETVNHGTDRPTQQCRSVSLADGALDLLRRLDSQPGRRRRAGTLKRTCTRHHSRPGNPIKMLRWSPGPAATPQRRIRRGRRRGMRLRFTSMVSSPSTVRRPGIVMVATCTTTLKTTIQFRTVSLVAGRSYAGPGRRMRAGRAIRRGTPRCGLRRRCSPVKAAGRRGRGRVRP